MADFSMFRAFARNPKHARADRARCVTRLLLCASALACGGTTDALSLSQTEQPILGGSLDVAHPEVMLLASSDGFLCTGTVIARGEQRAALLTAAHCVTEEGDSGATALPPGRFLVIPGTDFAESTQAFAVDRIDIQPDYDGSITSGDIALVRFVTGGEPVGTIPPLFASDAQLIEGDTLTLVGYGRTETGDDNTSRRSVERVIDALDAELVAYSQEDGNGACFGDSGGPGLLELNGEERVAVVISGGITDAADGCSGGLGVATRVSGYEDFIQGVLDETLGD